jgi:tRNA(Ile)-lysidine synthase
MNFFEKITIFAKKNALIKPNQTIIIGYSGGPDSTLLFEWLISIAQQQNLNLIAAHLNHGWRAEAEAEEKFCQEQAKNHSIAFIRGNLKDYITDFKCNGSKEDLARHARRTFFESIAHKHPGSFIALGHHKNDQEENFFIRLIRGSSLSGLCGMQPKNGPYIRPLLAITKKEIIGYLDASAIPFVEDASNASNDFLRNRIRNQIMPLFQSIDNRFEKKFHTSLEQLQEIEAYFIQQTETIFDQITEKKDLILFLKKDQFLSLHPLLQKRILIKWLCLSSVPFIPTAAFLKEIIRFIENKKSSSHFLHPSWKLVKKGSTLFIQNNS